MQRSLIIEDDVDANELLADLVRDRRLEPIQTYTGTDGLRVAQAERPDLIFLDVMLPDLHGYKVCEILKMDRATNPIPIVMVTAMIAEENRIQGYRVGADVYITKPYTPEDIDQSIATARAQRRRFEDDNVEIHVQFDLTSEIGNLKSVNELIRALLMRTRIPETEVGKLRTALAEMGQNAIEWGNKYDSSKLVKIDARVTRERVVFLVEDEGDGFDPSDLPHASVGDENDPVGHIEVREELGIREGGFGILITRGLVDEISYNEAGNAVTFVKHLV